MQVKDNRRSLRRRVVGVLVGVAMLTSAHAAVSASPVAAYTLPGSCTWGDKVEYITSMSKPWLITHVKVIILAAGSHFSSSVSETKVNSVTASVTGSVSGTAEAGVILAKASVTASLTLQAVGQHTQTTSHTDTWSFGPYTNDRTYVVFTGTHKVSGNWDYYQCTRFETWGAKQSGSYVSWDVEIEGSANCASSYATTSIQYKAKQFCP